MSWPTNLTGHISSPDTYSSLGPPDFSFSIRDLDDCLV